MLSHSAAAAAAAHRIAAPAPFSPVRRVASRPFRHATLSACWSPQAISKALHATAVRQLHSLSPRLSSQAVAVAPNETINRNTAAAAAGASAWRKTLAVLSQRDSWVVAGFLGALAGAVFLGIDWLMHDYAPYLNWRMKQALREGRLVPPPDKLTSGITIPIADLPSIFYPGESVANSPVMLHGPSGCGKSTYAHRIAWDNVSGETKYPTALVRFRLPPPQAAPTGDQTPTMNKDAARHRNVLAAELATSVCSQLNFPTRYSWISWMLSAPTIAQRDTVLAQERMARARNAIWLLFFAAFEIKKETGQAPLLIFDDVHGLMNDAELRTGGGEGLFHMLGEQIAWYGVAQNVNVIAIGTSTQFIYHWGNETSRFLWGPRITTRTMPDPTRAEAYSVLASIYTPEEANKLLDACGCRLELLQAALLRSASVAAIIGQVQADARAAIKRLFEDVASEARPKLVALLDGIARADADPGRDAATGRSSLHQPTTFDAPFPMKLTTCPPSAFRVLNVGRIYGLQFQSEAVRQAWAHERERYTTAS